jgi:hypothetical protein
VRLIQIWSGSTFHCQDDISLEYKGVGLGFFVWPLRPWGLAGTTSQKLLVFNEMVTTRPEFGCYRLIKAEDDSFVVFQIKDQLCSEPWVVVGML